MVSLSLVASGMQRPPEASRASRCHPMAQDLVSLGAVHARELSPEEYQELPTWATLLSCQRRRLLAALDLAV